MPCRSLLATVFWATVAAATPVNPTATVSTELYVGAESGIPQQQRPPHPTITYWRLQWFLRPDLPLPKGPFKVLLPLSDAHQQLLSRRLHIPGFRFEEQPVVESNLQGLFIPDAQPERAEVVVDWDLAVKDSFVDIPDLPFPQRDSSTRNAPAFSSPAIQSDDAVIRKTARELTAHAKTTREAIWSLFQFTANSVEAGSGSTREDALTVLRRRKGTMTGRARLLTALLQASGIPARIVGGLRLEDAAKKRSTIAWVEAQVGDVWVPLDPTGGHFAWLPNRYLALYRGDLPLITYPSGTTFDYGFLVQRSRKTPVSAQRSGKTSQVMVPVRPLARTLSTYVENAIASVVVFTDQQLPQQTVERIFREATDAEINVVVLTVPQAPRYFRQQYLQRLVSNNLTLIQGAQVLLLHTSDDSALFASLVLGETGIKLGDARVVIAGDFAKPVGTILGAVLYKLIDAGEVVLLHRPVKLAVLWSLVRANLLDGTPFPDEAGKWALDPTVVDFVLFHDLPRWRRWVVDAWAKAVAAQVPLQALTFILVLPVIAALVVWVRTTVGVETLGIFAPVIVSLAFLTTGLLWGVVIFVTIVGTGSSVRLLLQRVRLQLVSRLAILITIVAGIMAGLAVAGASFGIGALLNVSIFPMVIMSNMIEHFASSRAQFGTREAIRLTINTLLMAALCYACVEWTGLQSLLLSFPEILVGAVVVDILLGKWRGLRLLEYARFWPLAQEKEWER